jgi:hypothetical protein
MRAILGFLQRRARDAGVADGRRGTVTIVQRFGGALNTNIHFHAFVLDGVFSKEGDALRFHPCPCLDAGDVADVLATVEAYLHRLLGREAEDASDQAAEECAAEAPVLARLGAASVQGRAALGPRAGARVRRSGDGLAATTTDPGLGPCHARHAGFDLHAGVCVDADERDRLERVTRYALRPPVAQEHLEWTADGQVQLELRRHWSDGTTHLRFDPVELLERLAALVPRPRINLILYHGVLAPRAARRARVVQYGRVEDRAAESGGPGAEVNEVKDLSSLLKSLLPPSPPSPLVVVSPQRLDITDAPASGSSLDAKIAVVEFSDFECPFCGRHARTTYAQIHAEFVDTGLVQYIFKHLPLEAMHPN